MKTFERIIHPVTLDEFAHNNWRKQPLFVVKEDSFQDIITQDDINNYLGQRTFIYPYVRVVANGSEVDKAHYALDFGPAFNLLDKDRVFKLFNNGSTIVLQAANLAFDKLNNFTRILEQELGVYVQANIYITPSNSKGFYPHIDTHEVFVLQISGSKAWNIYDVPIPAPNKGWQITDKDRQRYMNSKPLHELVLHQGDILYVPSGVAHDAYTTGEHSIHVTFGIHPVRGLDILNDLIKRAEESVSIREAFFPLVHDTTVIQERTKDFQAQIVQMLTDIITEQARGRGVHPKYKDTTNVFNSIIAIDNLVNEESLDDIILSFHKPQDKNEADELLINKIRSAGGHVSGLLAEMNIESIKKALKDLVRKGALRVSHKTEEVYR
jgi:lysine-specific demethylase/histidyl-hydroxylase NO66